MQRMLVGVDGSAAAHRALVWSADVARRGGFDLVVARVFEPTQAELSPEIDTRLHAEQRVELEGWCENVRGGRLDNSASPWRRTARRALLAAAVDCDADLIVVGGGAVKLGHLDASSVSDQLVHTSTLPLAVVPTSGAALPGNIVLAVDGSPESLAAADFVAGLAARLAVGVTTVFAFEPFVELVPRPTRTAGATSPARGPPVGGPHRTGGRRGRPRHRTGRAPRRRHPADARRSPGLRRVPRRPAPVRCHWPAARQDPAPSPRPQDRGGHPGASPSGGVTPPCRG